jgi:hypothetical protein
MQQLSPSPAEERAADDTKKAIPRWLLLGVEVACLAVLLRLILTLLWATQYLTLGDVQEYHRYALAFWTQAPLFHQFPREYPPLAVIPFLFTLSSSSSLPYSWAFAWWMGAMVCLAYLWLASVASHRKALIFALYLLAGTMGTLLTRYDLLPALVTFGALLLAERKRYTWAYALLAVGVLLKLYPVFLVPVLAAKQWRESMPLNMAMQNSLDEQHVPLRKRAAMLWQHGTPLLKGLGVFGVLVALGFGVPLAMNTLETTSVFSYNLDRPTQLESVPASLLWLASFFGFPVRGDLSFGSVNLVGALESPVKLLSLVGLVGGLLLIYWRVWRGKLSPGQAFLAAVGVLLISNKVLSPQYFIWILPLVAYVAGFDLLWLLICIVTTLIYPVFYHLYYHVAHEITNPVFLWTIAIRNALLLIAIVRAVQGKPAWRGRRKVVHCSA